MEIFNEKETNKVQYRLLICAAIFLLLRYLLFFGFQVMEYIGDKWWYDYNLGDIAIWLGILITNFGYLFLLMLGVSSNIKNIRLNSKLEKGILALIFTAIVVLIITGMTYTLITISNFFKDILGYYALFSFKEWALVIRTLVDIITIMSILILIERKLQKQLDRKQYGKRLITPWLLIPITIFFIGLLTKMILLLIEHPASEITDFYSWEGSPFPIFYLLCNIALIAYRVVGSCIAIEFLIKTIKLKKKNDLETPSETVEQNELFEDEKRVEILNLEQIKFLTKNDSFNTIGKLIITRYLLFIMAAVFYLMYNYSSFDLEFLLYLSIMFFLGVMITHVSIFLVILHETSINRKISEFTREEKMNFAFIVLTNHSIYLNCMLFSIQYYFSC